MTAASDSQSSATVCRERSVPFGKYWRSSPLVFSFVPRCHGLPWAVGIAEVDLESGIDAQLGVLGHLLAAVPGQRPAELIGQRSHL
jgi:hypothetical protein